MNIEEIKERYNRFDFVHSYVDDNGCDDEWKDAHVPIGYLLSIIEQATNFFEKVEEWESFSKENVIEASRKFFQAIRKGD